MIIRDLEGTDNTLNLFEDTQGDIYVTIRTKKNPFGETVRVGGPASGHSVPPDLMKALHDTAKVFKEYEDCKNEKDAYDKFSKKSDLADLNKKIATLQEMLSRPEQEDNDVSHDSLRYQLEYLQQKRDALCRN